MRPTEDKCDPILGEKIEKYLIEKGVQTPTIKNNMNEQEKIESIKIKFKEIMESLGMDLKDDSLMETPKRVSKMFVKELYWGLNPKYFPRAMTIENKMTYNEMVTVRNITSMSACEHHFVTIDGVCNIAYIPKDRVLGLSKLNRIVEYFSRRPQIQERLTEQIFYALEYILGTDDIAIVINGKHYCVKSRGIEDLNSDTITSKMGGKFMSVPTLRTEFLSLIRK